MAITIQYRYPITHEYLCENVIDEHRRKIFSFRGRKEIMRRQRANDRQKEREKDDRYPIIAEDRLARPKIVHVEPRHRRLDHLALKIAHTRTSHIIRLTNTIRRDDTSLHLCATIMCSDRSIRTNLWSDRYGNVVHLRLLWKRQDITIKTCAFNKIRIFNPYARLRDQWKSRLSFFFLRIKQPLKFSSRSSSDIKKLGITVFCDPQDNGCLKMDV